MLKYAYFFSSFGMGDDCASCAKSIDVSGKEAKVTELVKKRSKIEELIDHYERGDRCYSSRIVY